MLFIVVLQLRGLRARKERTLQPQLSQAALTSSSSSALQHDHDGPVMMTPGSWPGWLGSATQAPSWKVHRMSASSLVTRSDPENRKQLQSPWCSCSSHPSGQWKVSWAMAAAIRADSASRETFMVLRRADSDWENSGAFGLIIQGHSQTYVFVLSLIKCSTGLWI